MKPIRPAIQRTATAAALACAGWIGGCGPSPDAAPPADAGSAPAGTGYPATRPLNGTTGATTLPINRPPTTGPAVSLFPTAASEPAVATAPPAAFLMIDRQPVRFPPARIVVKKSDLGQTARVYSDDPPEAINSGYGGSSFYLDMSLTPVPGGTPGELADSVWTVGEDAAKPAGVVRRKSSNPNGVYLDGGRRVLQPAAASVTFTPREDGRVLVRIAGTFDEYASGPDAAPTRSVRVTGMLVAKPAE